MLKATGAAVAIGVLLSACSMSAQTGGPGDSEGSDCLAQEMQVTSAVKAIRLAEVARSQAVRAYNDAVARQGKLAALIDAGNVDEAVQADHELLSDELPALLNEANTRSSDYQAALVAKDFVLKEFEQSCGESMAGSRVRGLGDESVVESSVSAGGCEQALRAIDDELKAIATAQAQQNAYQNRLASTISSVQTASESMTMPQSRIREPLAAAVGETDVGMDAFTEAYEKWSQEGISATEMEVVLRRADGLRRFTGPVGASLREQIAAWQVEASVVISELGEALSQSQRGVDRMDQRASELSAQRKTYLPCPA